MKALTLTTAGQLQPGDVFYKFDDINKTKFTVQDYARERAKYDKIHATKEGLKWPDPILKNTEVVFLKHINVEKLKLHLNPKEKTL